MGDHNMLTLDTPYVFLMCFLTANSESSRALRTPGAFKVMVRGDVFDQRVRKRESLERKPERQCFVTPVVAIVCLLQPSACAEY